jgi:YggT family protein
MDLAPIGPQGRLDRVNDRTEYDRTEYDRPTNDYRRPATPVVERSQSVSYDSSYGPWHSVGWRLIQLIYLIFGIVEGLVAIRFVLKALGANPNAGFAQLIYGLTANLVAPFASLFPSPTSGGMVIETASIVALIVYPLVAWVLAKLVWLLVGGNRAGVTTRTTSVR